MCFFVNLGRNFLKSSNVGRHFYAYFRDVAQIFSKSKLLGCACIPISNKKFRIIFYNICYSFWGQHCWWTDTNIICYDFLFFMSFHCSKLFYCSPCSAAAPASLNLHVVSTNFAKALVANLKIASYCDVTSSVYPVAMTTIRHGSILEVAKGILSSSVPGHHQISARNWALVSILGAELGCYGAVQPIWDCLVCSSIFRYMCLALSAY